jgi:RNA polymerase sigma factor (sigma-70 family)
MQRVLRKMEVGKLTDEQRQMAEESYPLVYAFLKGTEPHRRYDIDIEEVVGELHVRLCTAAMRYRQDSGCKFSTYASSGFSWGVKSLLRRKIKREQRLRLADFSERTDLSSPSEMVLDIRALEEIVDNANLPERTRDIMKLYFFGGKTLKDIGSSYGLCAEGVRVVIKKGLTRLRQQVKSHNYEEADFWIDKDSPYGATVCTS